MWQIFSYGKAIPLLVLLFFSVYVVAQEDNTLAVFINCNCDKNYLRQEIFYVNHVRDQALADIQLFIYDIGIGGGGRSYTLNFEGKNAFKTIVKELVYETTPNMTDVEVRDGLTKTIEIGLLHYLLASDMANDITFTLNRPKNIIKDKDSIRKDNWRNWIFEIYGEGEFDKESSRSNFKLEFGYEGDKVTEKWRVRTDIELRQTESKFKQDGVQFKSETQKYEFDGSIVRSISCHWSVGVFSGIENDSYNNQDLSVDVRPAIEYNIFPYKEVLRREITFAYSIGYIFNKYQSITIFNKLKESLYRQNLNLEAQFRQPWGNVSAELSMSSFLHDFTKNRMEFESDIAIRVYKGLAVRFASNMQLIRDQISLPAGDTSIEDLLLQQRQIATDFELAFSVGLSFTFGSAYNNIINTRL